MTALALLPLLLLPIALRAGDAAGEPIVLVTAYGPFAGRGVNGSETVARALDGVVIAGARVRIAVLPVRWGEPARRLPALLADAHPALLVGLGEGLPGRVAVERIGRNHAEQPDEEGHEPPSAQLDERGPATRAATLPFDATWFTGSAVPVIASEDAGAYLCNAWLYTAAGCVAADASAPGVGFVHLPPQEDEPAETYRARLTPIVRTLIERALAAR